MKKSKPTVKGFLPSCAFAVAVFVSLGLVLLLVSCAVAVSLDDPSSVAVPLSLVSLYLASFGCGIAASGLSGAGIAAGALAGTFASALVLALSLLPLSPSGFDQMQALIYALLIIPASVLGSVIGRKRPKKQKFPAHKQYGR